MATVDITVGATAGHPSRRQKHVPYVVRERFTGAAAAAAKGSALATADVVQCLDIPINTMVLAAGLEVITADTGTTASTDVSVASTDFVSAAALTTAAVAASVDAVFMVGAAVDTVDLVLGTLTAANDDWVVEVWAVLVDVSAYPTVQSAKGT